MNHAFDLDPEGSREPSTAARVSVGTTSLSAPPRLDSRASTEAWCRASEDAAHIAVLSFSPFKLDLTNEILWRGGERLRLSTKPFTILRHLAEHPQRLVRQQELIEVLWGCAAISESLVRTHVYALRRVVGEGVIETVNQRGYRFVLEVTRCSERICDFPHNFCTSEGDAHKVGADNYEHDS
jgi:DNA-binding winged helix-turn-helix (wHTH) protein